MRRPFCIQSGYGNLPSLALFFFCFIQPPCTRCPHQYLHTPSFLGLFIFLGPFCTVAKFCSMEVDRICRWYQSLLSLLLRARKMAALEEGTGWEKKEYWAMIKAVLILFKKCVSLLLRILIYLGLHFSVMLLIFYTNKQNLPSCSPATVTTR